ncbi:MAG TPA: hypothetical protein VMP68_23295 [Candidatus Eisenbacteria bacterium]|nr:hypothetical protein [Candidatus Eisenbacteria bacterium]
MGTSPSPTHQSRIYDYAREPGGKRGPALKGAQVGVGLAQAVLHGVLGIFFITQQGHCSLIEPGSVESEKMLQGLGVSCDRFLNDRPLCAPRVRRGRSVGAAKERGSELRHNIR